MQGMSIQSQVRELRSFMLSRQKKKKTARFAQMSMEGTDRPKLRAVMYPVWLPASGMDRNLAVTSN